MKELDLSRYPNITDEGVEASVKNFPDVEFIILEKCQKITDKGLRHIADYCPNLLSLNLKFCDKITGEGISSILASCQNVYSLELSYCTGVRTIHCLCPATSLEYLSMNWCGEFRQEDLQEILTKSTRLKSLSFEGSQLLAEDDTLSYRVNLPQLKRLNLLSCKSGCNAWIKALIDKSLRLEELCIAWCKDLRDESLEFILCKCPKLKILDIEYCNKITANGLVAYAKTKRHLERINVKNCTSLTDVGLAALVKQCPKLNWIDYSGCTGVNELVLCTLVTNCPYIVHFQLDDRCSGDLVSQLQESPHITTAEISTRNIIDRQLDRLLDKFPNLQKLRLARLTINGEGLSLKKKNLKLQSLELYRCEAMTDYGFGHLTLKCPNLRSLTIFSSLGTVGFYSMKKQKFLLRSFESIDSNLKDEGLLALAKSSPHLQELAISGYDVADTGLAHIAKWCRKLQILYLEYCKISPEGVVSLVKQCPHLRDLHIEHCDKIREAGLDNVYAVLQAIRPSLKVSLH